MNAVDRVRSLRGSACPSCGRALPPVAQLVDGAREAIAAAGSAAREQQEQAVRGTVRTVVVGLRCHLGRCVLGRDSAASLRERAEHCERCGFEMPTLATLERRLTRWERAADVSRLNGAMAVVMLDIALTKTLRALDCRLKRCRGGSMPPY